MPYDYTVEVTNRVKGLDLIDKVPEEVWVEVCNIVQEAVIKTIPKKKKCKKAKWLSEEDYKQLRKEEKQKAKEAKVIFLFFIILANFAYSLLLTLKYFGILLSAFSGFLYQFCSSK